MWLRTLPLNKDARKAIEKYVQERPITVTMVPLIGQRGSIEMECHQPYLKHYGGRLNIR
ncbi:hypothetical protein KHA80_07425 [Anaerobacillus sp. HL2]|nr:hypothetical protein KHA80_07425 [Anaerobacillus sp. HL2]